MAFRIVPNIVQIIVVRLDGLTPPSNYINQMPCHQMHPTALTWRHIKEILDKALSKNVFANYTWGITAGSHWSQCVKIDIFQLISYGTCPSSYYDVRQWTLHADNVSGSITLSPGTYWPGNIIISMNKIINNASIVRMYLYDHFSWQFSWRFLKTLPTNLSQSVKSQHNILFDRVITTLDCIWKTPRDISNYWQLCIAHYAIVSKYFFCVAMEIMINIVFW